LQNSFIAHLFFYEITTIFFDNIDWHYLQMPLVCTAAFCLGPLITPVICTVDSSKYSIDCCGFFLFLFHLVASKLSLWRRYAT